MYHIVCVLFLVVCMCCGYDIHVVFFFQAEDGIRDLVRSRGLGDVYKRQEIRRLTPSEFFLLVPPMEEIPGMNMK